MRPCLLIAPPDVGMVFPRGIVELGSFLESRGHSVVVLPLAHHLGAPPGGICDSGWADAVRRVMEPLIQDLRPAVIGVSNLFSAHHLSCLKILEICKQVEPGALTILGGPHPTFLPEQALAWPFVDVVVRGEGEWTMLELLERLAAGRGLEEVAGLSHKAGGRAVHNPDRKVGDLEELPRVNLGLLPEAYLRSCDVYGFMNRGCAFRCSFCAEHRFWQERRDYPIDRVLAEVGTLKRDFGNSVVGIEDSMVHLGSPQFKAFCRGLLERRVDLSPEFFVLSRVDTIDDDGLRAMLEAGIRHVRLGIESGSPRVRKYMNKGFTDNQIRKGCSKLKDAGARALAFWIIGHPGENAGEADVSLGFLDRLLTEELVDAAVLSLFLPYPGTGFFSSPKSHGLEILTHDWPRWQRWSESPVCQLDGFSAEQIRASYVSGLRLLVRHGQHLHSLPHEGEFSSYLASWAASTTAR